MIEAEGPVSVQVVEEKGAAGLAAPQAAAPQAAMPPQAAVPPQVAVPQAVVPQAAAPVAGGDLFARLSALRRELSAAQNVPPYVVFKDAALREMAEKLPQDLAAFGNIEGVGKAKLEKYGERFLAVIKGVAA